MIRAELGHVGNGGDKSGQFRANDTPFTSDLDFGLGGLPTRGV